MIWYYYIVVYICEICKKKVPSGTKCRMITVDSREKWYSHRAKANRGYTKRKGQLVFPLTKSRKNGDRMDDPGGHGWEIAREIRVCPQCAIRYNEEQSTV